MAAILQSPLRHTLSLAVIALAAAAAWLGLTGGGKGALWVGAPTVALTVLVAARAGLPAAAPRLAAVPGFLAMFAGELAQSAIDLARRLLRSDPGFTPGFIHHRLRLRGDAARAAYMNAVTLTPGSLSVRLRDDVLIVHSLDGDRRAVRASLSALEAQVARLYGETP